MKTGDKVILLDGSEINGFYGSWLNEMKKDINKVFTVESIVVGIDAKPVAVRVKEKKKHFNVWDIRAIKVVKFKETND